MNKRGETPADMVGLNRHAIRRILAAHRAWRRRGWLLLCRVRAARKMHLAGEGSTGVSLQHVSPTIKKANVKEKGSAEGASTLRAGVWSVKRMASLN